MPGPGLPSADRIVVALWRAGKVRAAKEHAAHAIARNDPARGVLVEQVTRLNTGVGLDKTGPVPELDFSLVVGMVDRYRFFEAASVLHALGLPAKDGRARRLAGVLEDALSPFPADADPSFEAALHLMRAGQAPSALRALEEVLRQTAAVPEWLSRRQRALAALVGGAWWQGPEPVEQVTRDTVLERIRRRDLHGALEAAERADATELAAILKRLVTETEGVFSMEMPEGDDPRTVPMEGHGLGEFHIRMGVLKEAEKVYRKLLEADHHDERARDQLNDVIALRRALGEDAAPPPPREVSSVHWLSKKKPKRSAEWSAGDGALGKRYPKIEDDVGDDSTDVLEAAQEAELLLKLGKAPQALDVYRILAIRHPKQQLYQRRIREIEALIAQRAAPNTAEITVRRDLRALTDQAIRTDPAFSLEDVSERFPRISEVDEEANTTSVDSLPKPDDD